MEKHGGAMRSCKPRSASWNIQKQWWKSDRSNMIQHINIIPWPWSLPDPIQQLFVGYSVHLWNPVKTCKNSVIKHISYPCRICLRSQCFMPGAWVVGRPATARGVFTAFWFFLVNLMRHVESCVMSQWVEGRAGVLTSLALASWRWCYAHARGLGTCVTSPWGEGWVGVLTSLALTSWRWCYAHAQGLGTCVTSQWGEGWAGVLTSLALTSWRWCYAHARGLGTCVTSQWGEGWVGVLMSLALAWTVIEWWIQP